MWSSGQKLFFTPKSASDADNQVQLDPAFVHLRVTVLDSYFFATRVHSQSTTQGLQEVWITPAQEILRTRNGRLTSTNGSAYTDWVTSSTDGMTSWHAMAKQLQAGRSVQYLRTRDVQPGDFIGLKERITVTALTAAPAYVQAPQLRSSDVHWFEERSEWLDNAGRLARFQSSPTHDTPLAHALPPAKFAVRFYADGGEEVLYSEQCLSYKVCLRMQRWPDATATAADFSAAPDKNS